MELFEVVFTVGQDTYGTLEWFDPENPVDSLASELVPSPDEGRRYPFSVVILDDVSKDINDDFGELDDICVYLSFNQFQKLITKLEPVYKGVMK